MEYFRDGEHSPLLRHMSMEEEPERRFKVSCRNVPAKKCGLLFLLLGCVAFVASIMTDRAELIVPIERASEHYIEVDDGIFLWYRIWGNRDTGVPLLFVHGGPGNAVQDYGNGNKRFFDASEFFVVEVDQRGTGKSKPGVRDDLKNIQYYNNISVDLISNDFEVIREHLGIEQWVVWGGSFGSTITLDYGMQFPERCLALMLRGIYLDTLPEVGAVYSLDSYRHNRKRRHEFEVLYDLANDYMLRRYGSSLDPNDGLGLMQAYEDMIQEGRRDAIWHWFVFENNLMEELPENLLDPYRIKESMMPEAQSIAFFETRLWLHASTEQPTKILERVDRLTDTPVWICQGLRDEVCPPRYADTLVRELERVGAPLKARFLDAGHEDTDPVMAQCLQRNIRDFLKYAKHSL